MMVMNSSDYNSWRTFTNEICRDLPRIDISLLFIVNDITPDIDADKHARPHFYHQSFHKNTIGIEDTHE